MGSCCSKVDPSLNEEALRMVKRNIPSVQPSAPSKHLNFRPIEQSSSKQSSPLPSTRQYCIETGKTAVEILKAASQFAPVPLVGEVLDVVLTLISVCEQATALEGQIGDLKDQLCSLGVILFNSVRDGNVPVATENRITRLLTDLDRIKSDLEEVLKQGSAVLAFYADANQGSVDDCVKRLNVALTEFHLSHDITTEQDLFRVLQRLEDMSSRLNHVDDGIQQVNRGIEEIKDFMKNPQLHNASTFSSGMPALLSHFRGRPGVIMDIANILCSDNPTKHHVAVLATGGMGKTTVAVQIMENDITKKKFNHGNRFWVSCKGAASFAIFLQVLAASLRIKTNSGNLQTDIRSELTASDAPRLVVLDNFETPWDTSDRSELEGVLCFLASIPHVAILITMRSNVPPSQNIDWKVEKLAPLDLNASRQIYTDINPSAAGHEALDDLLNALGHMPYAVKLIATLGEESSSPSDDLLERWREGGTEILNHEIDHSIRLSVDSNFMQSNPEAVSLLIILSMLPAGATRDHIKWWAPRLGFKIPQAIATLNRTALIAELEDPSEAECPKPSKLNPTFFVYPVVQSYMDHSGRISAQDRIDLQDAAFKFILDHKSSPGDPKFKDDLKALATEDVNLQGILTFAARQRMEKDAPADEILDQKLLDALLTFSLYQLRSKPTLDVATLAVDTARSLNNKLYLAEALDCLGRICIHLSDYSGAGDALKEARESFNSLPNPLRSGQTAYQLMGSYTLGVHTSAANALAEVLRADLTAMNANEHCWLRAITLLTIGYNLCFNGYHWDALSYFSDSQKEFEIIDRSYEGAECLQALSQCYGHLGKYSECMEAAQRAASEFEYFGLDAERNWIRGLECHLLLHFEDYDQALRVSEILLQESRKLGDVLYTAYALEFIAQVFEQREDVAAVQLGYESALEQYKIIGSGAVGQDGMWRCEYNLNILAQAMSEVEVEVDEGYIVLDGRCLMPQLDHLTYF